MLLLLQPKGIVSFHFFDKCFQFSYQKLYRENPLFCDNCYPYLSHRGALPLGFTLKYVQSRKIICLLLRTILLIQPQSTVKSSLLLILTKWVMEFES